MHRMPLSSHLTLLQRLESLSPVIDINPGLVEAASIRAYTDRLLRGIQILIAIVIIVFDADGSLLIIVVFLILLFEVRTRKRRGSGIIRLQDN